MYFTKVQWFYKTLCGCACCLVAITTGKRYIKNQHSNDFGDRGKSYIIQISKFGQNIRALLTYYFESQEGYCETIGLQERVKIDAFAFVPKYNTSALKRAIAKYGPACVSINQKPLSLKFYSWGVYDNPECGKNCF